MNSSISKHHKNLSSAIHISTFSKYFFPFGNFIVPLIFWVSNKDQSEFVDKNGKQALNFQITILLYSILIGAIAFTFALFGSWNFIDFINIIEHNSHHINFDLDFDSHHGFGNGIFILGISGLLGLGLLVLDIFCSINAAIKANEGIEYEYPLSIKFIK